MCVTTHKYKSEACGLGSCVADGRISLSGLSTAAEVFAKVREAVACSHQSVSRTRTERLSDDARTEESCSVVLASHAPGQSGYLYL